MPFTAAGRNALGTSGKAGLTHLGALTDMGVTEVTGGAYARQAVTWGAMSAGAATNSGALAVPIPAGVTPQAIGIYDALTVGNLLGWFPIGSTGQYQDGVATVDNTTDIFLSKAHGLTTDDRVYFSAVAGEAVPTGLSLTTLYFVLAAGLTTDAFQVSTTSGGAALNMTTNGECAFWKTVPNLFASAGNLTYAIGALTLDLTFT